MKISIVLTLLMAIFSITIFAQDSENVVAEKHAIEQVVTQFYFEVVFGERDLSELKKGFHEAFNMFVHQGNSIDRRSLQKWIERLEAVRMSSDTGEKPRYSHAIKMIDVTGTTGIVKIEIYAGEKLKYTDYLSLYRFEDGWKIVAKLFTTHP